MLTSLAMTLVLSCAKPSHPPHHDEYFEPVVRVTSSCEGPDRVERDINGNELRRFTNSCTIARCEGSDFVRRTLEGVTTERVQMAFRCAPHPRPQPTVTPSPSPLKFGLSMR
jgi:hypothetical protein